MRKHLIVLASILSMNIFAQDNFQKILNEINEAESNKLPKTAVELSLKLEKEALAKNNRGMYVRALTKRILNECHIRGKMPKDKLIILKEELKKVPEVDRPIMNLILANWYWHYFEQNIYKFSSRSKTSGLNEEDFSTWDSSKIYTETKSLFETVIKDREKLKKVSIELYAPILDSGNVFLNRSMSLYEFALRDYLGFLNSSTLMQPAPQDKFEIDINTDAIASSEKFLKYQPQTTDKDSFLLRSLEIYQELLTFYQIEKLEDQFVDLDLQRLAYVYAQNQNEALEEKFIKELESIEQKYKANPLSTLASFQLANLSKKNGKEVEAVNKCKVAVNRFSDSDGGKQCRNLIKEIEKPEFSIKIENTINNANNKIFLKYKNLNKIYFKVIEENPQEKLDSANPFSDNLWGDSLKAALAKKSVKEWSVELKPTDDYRQNEIEIELPDFKYGLYKIFASSSQDFSYTNNNSKEQLVYGSFWKSDTLVLVKGAKNKIIGYVLNAKTGQPINDVKVQSYTYKWNSKSSSMQAEKFKLITSDKTGKFEIDSDQSLYFYIENKKLGDVLYETGAYKEYRTDKMGAVSQALIFTDRAIYRPGQRIQFKVVCYQYDQKNDKYNTIQCKNTTLRLYDNNGQEIDKKSFSANEFGSFAGEFIAPKNVLLGSMSLRTDSPSGTGYFRVEEYKRPKFEVTLNQPEKQFRLNEEVEIKGNAISYSGAPLQGAKVKYRVVRGVKLPSWWHWANPYANEQEISNGTTTSDEKGEFSLKFLAKINANINPKLKPTFQYRIIADVIDIGGETRSSEISTNLGFIALNGNISINEWIASGEKLNFNLSIQNLDGKPQDVSGDLIIYQLKNPDLVVRKKSIVNQYWYWYRYYFLNDTKASDTKDLSSFENWEIDKQISKIPFKAINGQTDLETSLPHGAYVAVMNFKDQFGNSVEEKKHFIVLPGSDKFTLKLPSYLSVKASTLNVGDELEVFWGTGYSDGPIHFEIVQNGNVIQSFWHDKNQLNFKLPITEDLKGGFSLQAFFVKENQIYQYTKLINVNRTELNLKIATTKMRNKLRPGEKDSWSFKLLNYKNEAFKGEMAATLFDESLETFASHFLPKFSGYWQDYQPQEFGSTLRMKDFQVLYTWYEPYVYVSRLYPSFKNDIKYQFSYLWPYYPVYTKSMSKSFGGAREMMDSAMPAAPGMAMDSFEGGAISNKMKKESLEQASVGSRANEVNTNKKSEVKIRKNLNETAFFYPQLIADKDGNISFEFNMPEALTKWKFLGMAHGINTEWGSISNSIVTEQELMLTPNMPRFMRQGDKIVVTAKIDNVSQKEIDGFVKIKIQNSENDQEVTEQFVAINSKQKLSLLPKSSKVYSFELKVPNINYPILYTITAESSQFSDGEEGIIPILTKQVYVKESIPLWISDIGTKEFKFQKLIDSNRSDSLVHDKLVVQMVSNPAWYAVMAIPYLEKYYPECTDYVFERFFANTLGRKIIETNPKIETIFKQWKLADTLKSPLQKNIDLKGASLEETPWVMDAKDEATSKNKVATFFDTNSINYNLKDTFEELKRRMNTDGGWSWIPGGPIDYYTTLYIVTGFGKLKSLKNDTDTSLAIQSIEHLDRWIYKMYTEIPESEKAKDHFSHLIAYYLYGRSFFLAEAPLSAEYKVAIDYYLNQAKKYWTNLNSRLSEANTAIALKRFGDNEHLNLIIKSLKERALHDPEMGMYWGDEEWAYWWYRSSIEAQARIIELFSMTESHKKEVEEMKIWLIKQKQTTDWKTSKNTAEVVYTLLNSGADLLSNDKIVEVELADMKVKPTNHEAGTNFFEKRFTAKEIKKDFGNIKIKKTDKGIAYGSAHWHYFEDVSKVTPHKTPLSLSKSLWIKKDTKSGPTIYPIKEQKLSIGDTVVVRITLKTDRDMEYVMMKDMRGSGTEPLNTNSAWKYQDGLSYYESTRDTSTNFFFSYLPKGTYVFEYEMRIFQKGEFQSGLAEIQSLYAPEFSSHSESLKMVVD